MEDNPDMTVEGEKALSDYQNSSSNLVELQNTFEVAVSKMKDLKSSIDRNEQEMSDILSDMGGLSSLESN